MQRVIHKISYMQQTNRVLKIESKVDVIVDINKNKANAKQCKFCGTNHPYDRAKCPASGKCGKQGHFAVKCQEKKRVSCVPANKVHHTSATPGYAEGGESACESASDSDESIFFTERVGVVSSSMGKSS